MLCNQYRPCLEIVITIELYILGAVDLCDGDQCGGVSTNTHTATVPAVVVLYAAVHRHCTALVVL